MVPNSKLVVARTAFKDNTSFYTVNGRRVQFKEVSKLLRSHGIDLDHNRFLILQGEVEQIAMMKPKAPSEHESGMLEFLEDIIGTTRYKVSNGILFLCWLMIMNVKYILINLAYQWPNMFAKKYVNILKNYAITCL